MSRESDLGESYYVGAYWFDRPETREQCAQRTQGFLQQLARCHDTLSDWRFPDQTRTPMAIRAVPGTVEDLAPLFWEFDGPPRPGAVRGMHFSCYGLEHDEVVSELAITSGSNTGCNVAVISQAWERETPPALFHDPAALEAVVEAMITHWQPECAAVVSHAYSDRYPEREPDTQPRLPDVGWMTYLHAGRVAQIPAALPPEIADRVTARATPDGGRLFIVDTDHRIFTAANPEHVARTRALHGFLRDHGALEPTP